MAATTPRNRSNGRATPRKRAPARPVVVEDDVDLPQPIEISTKGRKLSVKKVVLFSINDHDYQVPACPTQGLVMRVIHEMRTKGTMFGLDLALEEMLGAKDYQTYLAVVDYLNDDEHKAIAEAVETHMLGAAERAGKD